MHREAREFVADVARPLPEGRIVLDIGSLDVNGGVRNLFRRPARYVGIDRLKGRGVDVVADAAEYDGEFAFDVAISTEAMEHAPRPQDIVSCAWRALKPGGLFIVTCAGPGREPHNCDGTRPLRDEHYANISPEAMRDLLAAWDEVNVTGRIDRFDVYATAIKPAA